MDTVVWICLGKTVLLLLEIGFSLLSSIRVLVQIGLRNELHAKKPIVLWLICVILFLYLLPSDEINTAYATLAKPHEGLVLLPFVNFTFNDLR